MGVVIAMAWAWADVKVGTRVGGEGRGKSGGLEAGTSGPAYPPHRPGPAYPPHRPLPIHEDLVACR